MITRILAVSSATLSLLALTVLPASAAYLTSDTSAVVGTPSVGASVGASGTATTNAGAETNSNYNSGSSTATSTSVSVTTTTTTTGDTTPFVLSNTDDAVLNFSNNATPAVSDASTVGTRDQLSAYAAGVMHSDDNIQNVQMSSSSVIMNYKQPGRFLGFIPVTVSTQAQVNQDGSVSISHPWYDFLAMTNDSAIRTSIQAQLQQSMASTTPGGDIAFSPQMQAQIMADMHTAFSDMSK